MASQGASTIRTKLIQSLAGPCLNASGNPPALVPLSGSSGLLSQSGLAQNSWPVLLAHAKLVDAIHSCTRVSGATMILFVWSLPSPC
ncbi:hypothetical protein CH063_04163 [Colletotrichum higginsianum]|uniref:Uncharacterized protein n=1 Tax=Colletotrichum higginsianum (strain IMI 349063) TaxID=759273 RepID=H1W4N8_COLHI|nr:hypothetical protein CH063_04163 [Colletotrichum higginsianum]